MDLLLFIGVAGLVCILTAFFLEEFTKHTRQESLLYNELNLIGALLLMVYSWPERLWPFIVLNGVWTIVAAVKLWQILRK